MSEEERKAYKKQEETLLKAATKDDDPIKYKHVRSMSEAKNTQRAIIESERRGLVMPRANDGCCCRRGCDNMGGAQRAHVLDSHAQAAPRDARSHVFQGSYYCAQATARWPPIGMLPRR